MAITLLPGQVVGGKYHISGKLGEGGMGTVYAAEDPELNRRVALKLLKLESGASPNLVQRLINEARAANRIKHQGVARVTDHGRLDDGTPYIVMEYLQGESFDKRIIRALDRKEQCLGEAHLWVVVELLSVLAAAHAAGIVHRDIKPPNLFIIEDPSTIQGERVIVLDFGIAKLPDADSLTMSNVILGTMAYMAPEQARNAAKVSPKADVYAAGVLAYQIVSGRFPHEVEANATAVALGVAKLTDPPTPIEQYAPTVSPEVRAWVMRMLLRDPEKRPTAAEAEAEGRRVLGMVPRQTGSHDALVVRPTAPLPPAEKDTEEDYQDPTPSVSPQVIKVAMEALQATPSEQHFRGERTPKDAIKPGEVPPVERSPPPSNMPKEGPDQFPIPSVAPESQPLNTPISLSEMPSQPVAIAALRAPTHGIKPFAIPTKERTIEGAPQPLPAALRALPDEKTPRPEAPQAEPPQMHSRRAYWIGALVALLVVSVGSTIMLSTDRAKPTAKHPEEATPPPVAQHTPPVAPPPPVTVPAAPAVPTSARSVQNTTAKAETVEASKPAKPTEANEKTPTAKQTIRDCEPQEIVESCIVRPKMNTAQRTRLLKVLKGSGAQLCPGKRLLFSSLHDNPTIRGVGAKTQELLLLALPTLTSDSSFPSEIEIRCPVH